MQFKSCLKNDNGVVKQLAKQTYEEILNLAIKHGKMTEIRKGELLAKIAKIVANDLTAFSGIESDIKVIESGANGDFLIDIVAHYMKSDED